MRRHFCAETSKRVIGLCVAFRRATMVCCIFFFFSSRRRHTRFDCDWSSDVCSSDLLAHEHQVLLRGYGHAQLRSSELLCLQAQEIERLQRLVIRQRAALMAKETQLLWAREEREALEKAIPGLSRRVTLARRVESLLVRVQDRKSTRLNSSHSQ